ncbi:MAG: hypothetical protein U0W24_11525 [Bacteroidales bacterium]
METQIKIFHWLPRVLCICALLFVSLFSLDAFEPGLSLGKQILGFIIHQVPVFALLALLIVAWKWEYIGGWIFILLGSLLSIPVFMMNYNRTESVWIGFTVILMITFPFILVGILFIVSYLKKKKTNLAQ